MKPQIIINIFIINIFLTGFMLTFSISNYNDLKKSKAEIKEIEVAWNKMVKTLNNNFDVSQQKDSLFLDAMHKIALIQTKP